MFYIETINKIKAKFAFYNTKNIEFENNIKELEQKLIQLEKRINTIADYIQGPYTKQINQNFAEIQLQIDILKPIKNAKELAKHFPQIKQKDKKCYGSKQLKK